MSNNFKPNSIMKILTSFLFILIFQFIFSQSENDTISKINLEDNFYIIDSIQQLRSAEKFSTDLSTCYFQIKDDYAVFSILTRGRLRAGSGKIRYVKNQILSNQSVNTFMIYGDNTFYSNTGEKFYFGISTDFNSLHTIYILNSNRQIEFILKAHLANKNEIQLVKEVTAYVIK